MMRLRRLEFRRNSGLMSDEPVDDDTMVFENDFAKKDKDEFGDNVFVDNQVDNEQGVHLIAGKFHVLLEKSERNSSESSMEDECSSLEEMVHRCQSFFDNRQGPPHLGAENVEQDQRRETQEASISSIRANSDSKAIASAINKTITTSNSSEIIKATLVETKIDKNSNNGNNAKRSTSTNSISKSAIMTKCLNRHPSSVSSSSSSSSSQACSSLLDEGIESLTLSSEDEHELITIRSLRNEMKSLISMDKDIMSRFLTLWQQIKIFCRNEEDEHEEITKGLIDAVLDEALDLEDEEQLDQEQLDEDSQGLRRPDVSFPATNRNRRLANLDLQKSNSTVINCSSRLIRKRLPPPPPPPPNSAAPT